jgi:general secretion pathway protein M
MIAADSIKSLINETSNRYRQLTQTQRRNVNAGIIFLSIAAIYFLLLEPSFQFSARAQTKLEQEQQLLSYVTQHANRIRQINAARKQKTGADTSLLALASNTAGEHGLTIQRSEPGPDGKLGVWLSQVEFNQLLIWLDQLTNQYNIRIERVNIGQADKPAMVEAQIIIR